MEIRCDKRNRTLIVKIIGDIDHHTTEEIRNKIDKEFKRINGKDILFDFTDVSFMDSSGIGLIIGRYKYIEINGGKIAVFNMKSEINRIFEISGLFKIIKCYNNLGEALSGISNRG